MYKRFLWWIYKIANLNTLVATLAPGAQVLNHCIKLNLIFLQVIGTIRDPSDWSSFEGVPQEPGWDPTWQQDRGNWSPLLRLPPSGPEHLQDVSSNFIAQPGLNFNNTKCWHLKCQIMAFKNQKGHLTFMKFYNTLLAFKMPKRSEKNIPSFGILNVEFGI